MASLGCKEDLHASEAAQEYLVRNLDALLAAGEFRIFYQAIVRANSGAVCDLEALARWESDKYGFVQPALFIPALEAAHFIHKLDLYVVKQICRQYRYFKQVHPSIKISFNLSRLDFESCDIFTQVETIRRNFDVPPEALHIEVTETAFVNRPRVIFEALDRFIANGYEVWMDDFGTGYSSLSTLSAFSFKTVKIDMSLVKNIAQKESVRTILATIIDMLKRLHVETLAEGIETEEEFKFLQSVGCERLQGFYFSKPRPSDELIDKFKSGAYRAETEQEACYYSSIGRVSLSAGYVGSCDDTKITMLSAATFPLAVIEIQGKTLSTLVQNQPFAALLSQNFQAGRLEEFVSCPGRGANVLFEKILYLAAKAKVTGKEAIDQMAWGNNFYSLRLQHLAQLCPSRSEGDDAEDMNSQGGAPELPTEAYLMHLFNFTSVAQNERWEEMMALRSFVYGLYERIDLIDLDKHSVKNLHMTMSTVSPFALNTEDDKFLVLHSDEIVHPGDAKRFNSFFDLETLYERITQASGRLTECFRMHFARDYYTQAQCSLILIDVPGTRKVLCCFADMARALVTESSLSPDSVITSSLLLDAFLDVSDRYIFWKDSQRRFLGANKSFLDYYGFTSIKDIIGKTDEEVGWHVNPEPFKNDEDAVLGGAIVRNARGTCIAHGQNRLILANKRPIYREGRVVGLIGYFSDVTQIDAEQSRLHEMLHTDELTGLLNHRGLIEVIDSYVEAYDLRGIDFVVLLIDILGFEKINQQNGNGFANKLLMDLGRRITQAVGDTCVTGRLRGERFVVISAVKSREYISQLTKTIQDAVVSLKSLAGISCELDSDIEVKFYSDLEDVASLLLSADH